MTDPAIPSIPEPSDEWVAARRDSLIAEFAHHRRNMQPAITGIGLVSAVAAVVVVLVLMTASPGTQSAFAGWSATPARASSSQASAAKSACARRTTLGARDKTAPRIRSGDWHAVLSDVRGPFVAVVLQAAEGRAHLSCLLGPAPTFSDGLHLLYGNGILTPTRTSVASSEVKILSSGTAVIPGASNGIFRRIEGRIGTDVSGVTIVLENGKHIRATSSGGWFLAWWPGSEKATSVAVATTSGTHLQRTS